MALVLVICIFVDAVHFSVASDLLDLDTDDLNGLAARLQSCLEELHSIMGDNIPEPVLTETVMRNHFNIESSLNELLSLKGKVAFLKWVIFAVTAVGLS